MIRQGLGALMLTTWISACGASSGLPDRATLPVGTALSPTQPAITSSPTDTTTPGVTLPPGLLIVQGSLESSYTIWIVDQSGKMRRTAAHFAEPRLIDFDVSPDGMQVLYPDGGDIWLLDMATDRVRQVTHTPDRLELAPRWWPGHPGIIVCGSVEQLSEPSVGMLTLVGLDGTYQVVDEGLMSGIPAPRPTGDLVLYSKYPSNAARAEFDVWAYASGSGSRRLAASELGVGDYAKLNDPANGWFYSTGALSWSADGSRLGMAAFGLFEGRPQAGILFVDWTTRKAAPVMTFPPVAIEGPLFDSAPKFSPRGDWFVFDAWDDTLPNSRTYLFSASGVHDLTGEKSIGGQWADYPAISPDGTWIAILTVDGLGLIHTGDWQLQTIKLPERVAAVGWAAPPE